MPKYLDSKYGLVANTYIAKEQFRRRSIPDTRLSHG